MIYTKSYSSHLQETRYPSPHIKGNGPAKSSYLLPIAYQLGTISPLSAPVLAIIRQGQPSNLPTLRYGRTQPLNVIGNDQACHTNVSGAFIVDRTREVVAIYLGPKRNPRLLRALASREDNILSRVRPFQLRWGGARFMMEQRER